jgi:transaldolase
VTLIFSIERYEEVIEAYQSGLEELVAAGGDPALVASVASFFVSRVDTETDRRLEAVAALRARSRVADKALALRGKAAVAQARLAYETFERLFSGQRWEQLAGRGARPQRPLWASTSTKNPKYPDLAYVDTLVAPHTVNTMPEETLECVLDHGKVSVMGGAELDDAKGVLYDLADVGVDLEDVARLLEEEGVASFAKSFDGLIEKLTDKAANLAGHS